MGCVVCSAPQPPHCPTLQAGRLRRGFRAQPWFERPGCNARSGRVSCLVVGLRAGWLRATDVTSYYGFAPGFGFFPCWLSTDRLSSVFPEALKAWSHSWDRSAQTRSPQSSCSQIPRLSPGGHGSEHSTPLSDPRAYARRVLGSEARPRVPHCFTCSVSCGLLGSPSRVSPSENRVWPLGRPLHWAEDSPRNGQ